MINTNNMFNRNLLNGLTLRQQLQVSQMPRSLALTTARQYRQQNYSNSAVGLSRPTRSLSRPAFPYQRNRFFNNNNYNIVRPWAGNPAMLVPNLNNNITQDRRNRFRQGNVQSFGNGGNVNQSLAINRDLTAPIGIGFSLSNSGERNVMFSKEFVAEFLVINSSMGTFSTNEVSTHPAINSSTVKIAEIYQRYKILNYQFKYKASCPTVTKGMHYTGVDYGNQTTLPRGFTEAESLEHFSVGPIWQDSQDWHTLKLSNIKERWFTTTANSNDPESRPARIIFGSMGTQSTSSEGEIFGVLEVKVTYLFNGLGKNFTGQPPNKVRASAVQIPEALEPSEDDIEIVEQRL